MDIEYTTPKSQPTIGIVPFLLGTEAFVIRIANILSRSFFFIMASLVVTQVVLRYGFSQSIMGANEIAVILFAYTTSLGAAVAIAKREHITICWFAEQMPPTVRKLLDLLVLCLLFAINYVIFIHSLDWIETTGHTNIPLLQVPRWWAQAAVPLCTTLSMFFCGIKIAVGVIDTDTLGKSWLGED
ncbi:TRAP transporter small permease [Photobacterium makurazakiensis]|uniref:TRAP transporter small permease n=1 Tax=Photobacterium makurazakiensis TaxID=2910234 RepID=UPI003D1493D9